MRKIENQEIKEKKDSRNKVIISLILVGVMVLSTAGYAFYGSDESKVENINYNGFEFVKNNEFWSVKISGQEFGFRNLPNETSDIQVDFSTNLNEFANKPLYISEQTPGSQEILINIGSYVQRAQLACVSEPCKDNLPIKNCSDNNFIIFQQGEVNKVSKEDRCIYILYKTGEDVKASDAFLYRILGVN